MRVALITGAGTGIGRASALALARDGFTVVVAGRRLDPLEDVLDAIAADPDISVGGHLAVQADVASPPLPYETARFDLLTCFGMLDYLPWYDVAVREFSRVLRVGGLVAVALPNLASWHNRLALLLGYQPRDVEFCSVQVVGHAPMYREALPVGHIHTPTTRAFREFMSLMGFDEVRTHALRPMNSPVGRPLRVLDAVVGRFPSSSRRFLYLGRRAREPIAPSNDGWWSG